MFPIRCFSCHGMVGQKWKPYLFIRQNGYSEKEALHELHIHNDCCRKCFITYPLNMVETVVQIGGQVNIDADSGLQSRDNNLRVIRLSEL